MREQRQITGTGGGVGFQGRRGKYMNHKTRTKDRQIIRMNLRGEHRQKRQQRSRVQGTLMASVENWTFTEAVDYGQRKPVQGCWIRNDPYSANWLDSGHTLKIQPRQFLDSLFYPVLLSSVIRQKQDHLRIDSQSYQDLGDCLLTKYVLTTPVCWLVLHQLDTN